MAHFEFSSLIKAPRAQVFAFMTNPESLAAIIPPDYKLEPMSLISQFKKGLEYDLRVSRYGISILWGILIEDFEAGVMYRDRQTHGPFSLWLHTHRFDDHGQGTIMKDVVEYDLAFGLFGKLALDLYAKRELERVFTARHARLQELIGSKD